MFIANRLKLLVNVVPTKSGKRNCTFTQRPSAHIKRKSVFWMLWYLAPTAQPRSGCKRFLFSPFSAALFLPQKPWIFIPVCTILNNVGKPFLNQMFVHNWLKFAHFHKICGYYFAEYLRRNKHSVVRIPTVIRKDWKLLPQYLFKSFMTFCLETA